MGILEKLRRKRTYPSSHISDDGAHELPSPVNGNTLSSPSNNVLLMSPRTTSLTSPRSSALQSPANATGSSCSKTSQDEIDKENEPIIRSETARPKSLHASLFNENDHIADERDDASHDPFTSNSKPLHEKGFDECARDDIRSYLTQDSSSYISELIKEHKQLYDNNARTGPKSPLPTNDSIDELTVTSSNDNLITATSSDDNLITTTSDEGSDEINGSIGEITQLSDDNMLRDDEGNPIDPNEAEENMLRDDEGNIIDPKTLVVRDFLLDLSCESDEYYDDSGEKINPKELISVIGEQGPPIVTDSSTQSEEDGEDDCESEITVVPLHDNIAFTSVSQEVSKEPSRTPHRDVEKYEELETKGRRRSSSQRRRRRDRRSLPTGNDYFHIMFNNRLSTLDEESGSSSRTHSGDEADDESPRSRRGRQRSPKGSFDEKFICARWEYSLQMMTSGQVRDSGCVAKGIMLPTDSIDLEETGEI